MREPSRVSFRGRCIRHLIPQNSACGKRNDPTFIQSKFVTCFAKLSRCASAYRNGRVCASASARTPRLFFLFLFVFRLRCAGGGLVAGFAKIDRSPTPFPPRDIVTRRIRDIPFSVRSRYVKKYYTSCSAIFLIRGQIEKKKRILYYVQVAESAG